MIHPKHDAFDDTFARGKTRIGTQIYEDTINGSRFTGDRSKKSKDALLEADQQRLEFEKQKQLFADQQQAFAEWTQWVNTLKAGDDVHVRSLNTNTKVVRMQLHQQSALVTSGAMDIEVPLKDIEQPRDE